MTARNWIAVLLVLVLFRTASAQERWDPKKTYAVVVGLTEWKDKKVASFPKKGRQDRALATKLVEAGVPEDQVVFLADKQATGDGIRSTLAAMAGKAPAGSTLVFYFSGHGYQEGTLYLAPYDLELDDSKHTGFAASEIPKILDEHWKGNRLLLLGDACYAGGLKSVVHHFDGTPVKAALLASIPWQNQSNATWTFTDGLIKGFKGDAELDPGKTGKVTFAQWRDYLEKEMTFRESQPADWATSSGFDPGFVMGAVDPKTIAPRLEGKYQVDDWVDVKWFGKWRRAKVMAEKDGQYEVDMAESPAERWFDPAKVRPARVREIPVGVAVRAKSDNDWWDGVVRMARDGFALIHFDGFAKSYDEWVSSNSVRVPGGISRTSGLTGLLEERIAAPTAADHADDR